MNSSLVVLSLIPQVLGSRFHSKLLETIESRFGIPSWLLPFTIVFLVLITRYYYYYSSQKLSEHWSAKTANYQIFLVELAHAQMKVGVLDLTRGLGMIQK